MENINTLPPKIKDYSYQDFTPDDEKDFFVKTINDERLIDYVPGLDVEFDRDMYNFGDEEDLPNSDRIMQCQAKGIRQENCFDIY